MKDILTDHLTPEEQVLQDGITLSYIYYIIPEWYFLATLVVPKQETDYIFDLDDDQLSGLIIFSKKVAAGIKSAIPCNRIGIAVLGLEVPHVHIHLVPMDSMEDVNFRNPKLRFTPEEFNGTAGKIRMKLVL